MPHAWLAVPCHSVMVPEQLSAKQSAVAHGGIEIGWLGADAAKYGSVWCRHNCYDSDRVDKLKTTFGKTCFGFASHYDTTLQQQKLPQSAISSTITLVTLRDPVKRFISDFNHVNERSIHGRSYTAVRGLFQEWVNDRRQRSLVNQATLQIAGRCKVVMGRQGQPHPECTSCARCGRSALLGK